MKLHLPHLDPQVVVLAWHVACEAAAGKQWECSKCSRCSGCSRCWSVTTSYLNDYAGGHKGPHPHHPYRGNGLT